jgi:manganese transport protein
MAATAYMDPGNIAVNVEAGSRYGYSLLWVVLGANIVAMLFQSLSAKLGIATGRNLAELCRDHFPRPAVWAMWVLSELAAMATDLAEFVGSAIGLMLLFHMSMLAAMTAAALATWLILMLERARFRPVEIVVAVFVAVIGACYLVELLVGHVQWRSVAAGAFLPGIPDNGALTVAVGIIGATIMPHALYLHSGLTQARTEGSGNDRAKISRISAGAVIVALGIAGAINLAMVVMAGSAFHGQTGPVGIEGAYRMLGPLLGRAAGAAFLVSLIASGISSSVVGTVAGQIIMQGFIARRIPVGFRRLLTMLPAFAVVALGLSTTQALLFSQIILSLVLPVPMMALVAFTSRAKLMGACVNSRLTTAVAGVCTILVLGFNVVLLAQNL